VADAVGNQSFSQYLKILTITQEDIFDEFAKEFFASLGIFHKLIKDTDYDNLVRRVRAADADIIFGIYYGTKKYDGLDFVIPAVIDNPVVLMMLPHNANKVKSLNDLKKLKGAIFSQDKFNDFVTSQMAEYDIIKEKDNLEIFRKLFMGEIDYIFATYYFGVAKSSALGLRHKISISKQPIWTMPMFIGVAKASPHHESLLQSLMKFTEKEANRKMLQDALANKVKEYEQKSLRITPPVFSK
jgi:ABC-type amino acid transport substrate-binding protein